MKVFIVTGANKGIGYGIVRNLLKLVKESTIFLTARNGELGLKAVDEVLKEVGTMKDSSVDLKFHQLDITDEESCKKFKNYLENEKYKIDVLINNAGFAFNIDATESPLIQAKSTIGINYYGTKMVSKYLIPLIKDEGRIVNICSMCGKMAGYYSEEKIELFKKNTYTEEDIDSFVEKYIASCEPDVRTTNGYPCSSYRVSKAAEIALTMLYHRQLMDRKIRAIACCPGYVATDMTNYKGPLTIDEGTVTPLYCALNDDAPSGEFIEHCKVSKWLS
ncbi:Short-chain dehydrogenase/reductase SDR family and Glucose/ribitol dehydrogenase family and NAD(P)-binding domain-containing protein [Strongyloides ratti]|uniref:Short-chain dehydrogenase/reductase SDR family and Glucose/ribitol dehydrogenase family and NAD(P)-binding domain-containing protein n=1 Tax=Strongyloides ratti TaxID=34506 RepID=A0A090LLU3_STRRB|nr:Short-chain dehydrogenase/reductase SDR family and Glucose/ribitol dehydrogenase family and NAD(P)-binding domain-containing protein [Strongyloides ratti]CEF68530.1 Short-chain dehydrogenase/reductase SDR family and Glucose/ribitol dehydrogenase family and NAD(P)-binding domain-containing protein [Strongyloides ratti]